MPENALEIVAPYFQNESIDQSDVFMLGGLGMAALTHPRVQFDEANKVIAVPDLYIPSVRPDGTLRDVDLMVATTDTNRTLEVEAGLRATLQGKLSLAVCNIANGQSITRDTKHPFSPRTAVKGFTSNRYTHPDIPGQHVRYIFPFMAPLDNAHFEQWQVEVADVKLCLPVPPPASVLTNYLVRSVIGRRPADDEKVKAAAYMLHMRTREQTSWLYDGPGKDQLELSLVLNSIRNAARETVELLPLDERRLYSHEDLIHHEFFAPTSLSDLERRQLLATSCGKAALTFFFESNPEMKAWYRDHVEAFFVRLADRSQDAKA